MDPFVILPDACSYVDHQVLKLQEPPDMVPNGEMPRHVMLSVERSLVDRVSPGTRVHVLGVSSIFNSSATVSHMFRVCFGYRQVFFIANAVFFSTWHRTKACAKRLA